ncbi:MAG TPA: hypothetical protein VFQ61_37510 [Polyangiaceae bacterium]|nr:hypothetical protein [Polyangiaceae bacterium]
MSGCVLSDPFFIDPSASEGGASSQGGTGGASETARGGTTPKGGNTSGGTSPVGPKAGGPGLGGSPLGGTPSTTSVQGGFTGTTGHQGGSGGASNTQAGGAGGTVQSSTIQASGGSAGNWILADFETSTEGFGPPPEKQNSNTVSTTAFYHTQGKQGLLATMRSAEWVGAMFPQALDLSRANRIKVDIRTSTAPLQADVAIVTGSDSWCSGNIMIQVPAQTATTLEVNLKTRTCANFDASRVRGVYIWFEVGTYYADYMRTE